MIVHVARIAALTAVITASMFLPYLPGRYDGLAATLSVMAQVTGVVGLILVPLGAVWLIYERRASTRHRGYYFAIASLAGSAILAFMAAGVGFGGVGVSLGFGVLAAWLAAVARTVPRLKLLKRPERRLNAAPLYLLVVPLAVAAVRLSWLDRASEACRERAMRDSAALLNDIEKYRATYGYYPVSLLALHTDYEPSIMGIKQFHYERNGDGYNVYFEHPSTTFGTQEIVMYNTRDEHHFPSHDSDILLWTPEQLRARPGYYAVRDASRPHWKRFLFD
jgi:hypothetical protein